MTSGKEMNSDAIEAMIGSESGQAMAEYAIVTAVLMGGLIISGFNFLPEFIRAFQLYYDSFYMVLNLPVP